MSSLAIQDDKSMWNDNVSWSWSTSRYRTLRKLNFACCYQTIALPKTRSREEIRVASCWNSRICCSAFHQKDRNSPCLFYGYLEFLKEHVMNNEHGEIYNHQNIKYEAECGEHFRPRLNTASRNLRSIIFIYNLSFRVLKDSIETNV